MGNYLVNFALAKSIYIEKKNYLETFSPFVIKVLYEKKKTMTIEEIDEKLRLTYNLKIPLNTLKSIFSMLYNKKFVELKKQLAKYSLTINNDGEKYYNETIENEKIIKRRQNKFLTSFINYAKINFDTDYDLATLEERIISFINENLVHLIQFAFNGTGNGVISKGENDFNYHFSDYICSIEKSDAVLFDSFQEFLKGAILWGEISKKEDIEKEADIGNLIIYLDANYLLSLFNLDFPAFNNAADQLFKMLKRNNKIILRVFKITLDEIVRLLNEYKRQQINYFDVPVNNIYYALKSKGYDDAKVDLLIANLDKVCKEKGIQIEDLELLNDKKFNESDKELYDELYRFNFEFNKKDKKRPRSETAIHLSTLHDVTVIQSIRKKRGGWIKTLEKARVIFLTSSSRLNYFINNRSQKTNSFPETILDITLTNVLWLKNPANDIGCSVQHIIALHSKNILINDGIWRNFTNNLKILKDENKISNEEYAYLISNNQLTFEFLKNVEEEQINQQSLLELRDKIVSEQINVEKELKEAKEVVRQKDSEVEKLKKHSYGLQSQLDKTKHLLDVEIKNKALLTDQVKSIEDRITLKDYEDKREREISARTISEMKKIRKAFFRTFGGYIGTGILFIIAEKLLNLLELKNVWIILISAILFSAAAIFFNIAAGMEFKTKWKWLFKRKQLKKEIREKLSKEYEQKNPPPIINLK